MLRFASLELVLLCFFVFRFGVDFHGDSFGHLVWYDPCPVFTLLVSNDNVDLI